MFEFLLFLNAPEKEILDLIRKANYKIEENTPLCLISNKFFGFLKKQQRKVVICTENAKEYGGYAFTKDSHYDDSFKTGLMIRRALRHEAVHIAQECNNGKLLDLNQKLRMNPSKNKALEGSLNISTEVEKEKQAYILEDKPKTLKRELEKSCL